VYYTSPITQVISPSQNTVYPSSLSTTNALYWDTSGNVGIGTTSPTGLLDAKGNTNGPVVQYLRNDSTGASSTVIYQMSAGSRYVNQTVSYTAQFIQFAGSSIPTIYLDFDTQIFRNTAATERMRIDSSGNLLVGTTTQVYSAKQSVYSGVTNATTYNTFGSTGGSSLAIQQQQTTSVSTSATVILTPGLYSSFVIVFGSDGTNRFQDILNCSVGTGTVNVINSLNSSGTPGTRTYTQSLSTFRLAMSAGTYTVQVASLSMTG
jgi:hypothetical protein